MRWAALASVVIHVVVVALLWNAEVTRPREKTTSVIEPELVFVRKVEARAPIPPPAPKRSGGGGSMRAKKVQPAVVPLPVAEAPTSTGLSPGENEPIVGTGTISTATGPGGDGLPGAPAPRGITRGASVASLPHVDYPRAARENEIEGVVKVRVTIDESGHVLSAEILESPGYGLGETARSALLRAIFNPAMHDGQPVRTTFEYVYRFELRD